jgi:hypothetical protein
VTIEDEEKYIRGLVAQLRFIRQLCPDDVGRYAEDLIAASKGRPISEPDRRFLTSSLESTCTLT